MLTSVGFLPGYNVTTLQTAAKVNNTVASLQFFLHFRFGFLTLFSMCAILMHKLILLCHEKGMFQIMASICGLILTLLWYLFFSSVGMKEIFSKMLQCCLLNGGIFWVSF